MLKTHWPACSVGGVTELERASTDNANASRNIEKEHVRESLNDPSEVQ